MVTTMSDFETAMTMAKLKDQLKDEGYAQCPQCELAFLTLSGIKKHIKDGNFFYGTLQY